MSCIREVCRVFALAALGLLAAGCQQALEPGGSEWERTIGAINIIDAGLPLSLSVPDTVVAGTPFTVTVVTFGSSSCTRADGAQVRLSGLEAEITPYDRELRGTGVFCTGDVRFFGRDVELRFDTPGQAMVRVTGRTLGRRTPAQIEAAVIVRP